MKRTVHFETLQSRVLFAAPPAVILDTQLQMTIVEGTEPLATFGSYTISIRSTKNFYDIIDGDAAESTGKYTYSVVNSNTAQFVGDDSLVGRITGVFTFVTPSSGQFTLTRAAGGSQSGGFSLSSANMASLANGVLRLNGTMAADDIDVYPSGTRIAVTRNNVTEKFLTSSVNRIEVFAGEGNDDVVATGVSLPAYIAGEAGNDRVTGGLSNDTLSGGAGRNHLSGGPGDDRMNGSGAADSLFGDEGADRLYGGGGADSLEGGGGVDRAWGGLGGDTLIGGSGNDKLFGEDDGDVLLGQAGADSMDGGNGDDALNGGTGDDTLIGSAGADGLFGQEDNDMIFADDGARDTVVGGVGSDTGEVDGSLLGDDVTGIELLL